MRTVDRRLGCETQASSYGELGVGNSTLMFSEILFPPFLWTTKAPQQVTKLLDFNQVRLHSRPKQWIETLTKKAGVSGDF